MFSKCCMCHYNQTQALPPMPPSLIFVWALTRSFAHLGPNLIINECSMCVVRLGSMSVHLHTDWEFILTFQTGVHEKHALCLTLFFFSFLSSSSTCFFFLVFSHILHLFHLWCVKLEWVLNINQINQIQGEVSA